MKNYQPPSNPNAPPRDTINVPPSTINANNAAVRGFNTYSEKSKAENEAPLPIPNIFTVAEEWVQLRAKDSELAAREAELIAEAAKVKIEINDQHLFNWTTLNRLPDEDAPAPVPNKLAESARKLLGGLAPESLPKANNSPPAPPALILRRKKITEELEAIREARNLLAPEIRRAFLDGSVRLRKLIAPEFNKLQRDVFLAVIALGDAMLAYDRFMTGHRNMALSLLRPVIGPLQSRGLLNIGDPRDRTSPLRLFLQQAIDSGHLKEKDLPREWTAVDPNRWQDPY